LETDPNPKLEFIFEALNPELDSWFCLNVKLEVKKENGL
jgi:hypothetical protein